MSAANLLDLAVEVLKRYPLCDRCFGRLFGYLGKGMSNLERGKALKTAVILEIHRRLQENKIDLGAAREVLLNAQMSQMAKLLGVAVEDREQRYCSVCGNKVEEWIERFSGLAISMLRGLGVSSFVIGVTSVQDAVSREELIAREFGLRYRESVKRELKREIGKRVASAVNVRPDFSYPDVVLVADVAKGEIVVSYPSLILYGYYWKLGRMISQNVQIDREGGRRYQLAIEDAIRSAGSTINAQGYRLHTTGREEADVRVLGSGRPIAIEFKVPEKGIDMEYVERALNSFTPWLRFSIKMRATRDLVSRMKRGARFSRRVYRAVVYTYARISPRDLEALEAALRDRIVEQRTPERILRRRKDVVRRHRVYSVKALPIAPQLFEALVECDGGLYVKELVSGDSGRTRPSFSEVLGCNAECLMLDLLYVHEYI